MCNLAPQERNAGGGSLVPDKEAGHHFVAIHPPTLGAQSSGHENFMLKELYISATCPMIGTLYVTKKTAILATCPMMEVNSPRSFFSRQGLILQQTLRSWLTLLTVRLEHNVLDLMLCEFSLCYLTYWVGH